MAYLYDRLSVLPEEPGEWRGRQDILSLSPLVR